MLHETEIECPYCGERLTVLIDASAGDASYIEDCQICCQPIRITVHTDGRGTPNQITAHREDV